MVSPPSVSVRRATSSDARGILACLRAAFEPYRHSYTEQAFVDTVLTSETVRLRLASMAVLVAVTPAGEIVGTIGCSSINREEGHIRGMAVLARWLGCGVAKHLLQAAESELRSQGCRRVTLDTTAPLERAMRFYEKSGYRRSGKVGNFFGMPLFEYFKDLNGLSASLDHLILGASDLNSGIEFVEKRTGVRASLGGIHPGRGTRNALLSLGPLCYLEILAPDPKQAKLAWFHTLLQLTEPRLVGWMVRPGDLDALAERLRHSGVACDAPRENSRARPDGCTLRWKLLRPTDDHPDPRCAEMQHLVPFCIEWSADSLHPAEDAPSGLKLVRLEMSAPSPDELRRTLELLGVDLPVSRSNRPQLRALLAGPSGTLKLTS